ncbi:MAG TPA: hypothetical protein VLM40_19360 [Gemmata sp.]|nr:hypothetical protein [Gemmata sp.]
MAADRNKKAKKAKYANPKTGEFRHRDGDRRHRGGITAKDAIRDKKLRQSFDSGVPEIEPPS